VTEQQARAQIETNLFGALWVTKAALPYLREQGSGHIIQVSSIGGVQAFPTLGLYHASKWGLEAFSQSLAAEVADLGIKVTIVEPTGYTTDWAGPSSVQAEHNPAYDAADLLRHRAARHHPGGVRAAHRDVGAVGRPVARRTRRGRDRRHHALSTAGRVSRAAQRAR
jgi:NAD(P)-dependent dehydrogenase (short-subunit alcohol dehydrogenase family)